MQRIVTTATLVAVLFAAAGCQPERTVALLSRADVSSISVQTPQQIQLMSTHDPNIGIKLGFLFHRAELVNAAVDYYNNNRDGYYSSSYGSSEGFGSILSIDFLDARGHPIKTYEIGAGNQSVYDETSKILLYRNYSDHAAFFDLCRRFGDDVKAYCIERSR